MERVAEGVMLQSQSMSLWNHRSCTFKILCSHLIKHIKKKRNITDLDYSVLSACQEALFLVLCVNAAEHPSEVGIVIPILQVRKRNYKHLKKPVQGHRASEWQSWIQTQAVWLPNPSP